MTRRKSRPDLDTFHAHLDALKLSFIREHYPDVVHHAAEEQSDHLSVLERLIEGEARRPRSSAFAEWKCSAAPGAATRSAPRLSSSAPALLACDTTRVHTCTPARSRCSSAGPMGANDESNATKRNRPYQRRLSVANLEQGMR